MNIPKIKNFINTTAILILFIFLPIALILLTIKDTLYLEGLVIYILDVYLLAPLALEVYIKFSTKKISNFIIINKKNKIQQYISFKSAIKQSITLNFYDNKPQNIDTIMKDSMSKFEAFISETNISTLYTTTNKLMERQLRQIAKRNNLTIIKTNEHPEYKSQVVERLILMGLITTLYNLINPSYWKYITKTVKLNKFKIITN